MKNVKFLILILIGFNSAICQTSGEWTESQLKLYREIKGYTRIETRTIGCYGSPSKIFNKVEAFKNSISEKEFVKFTGDSSYIIRYYSFLTLLKINDSIYFQMLINNINDSTKIIYEFAGQNRGTANFNQLISQEYSWFIKSKYSIGGKIFHHGEVYNFDKKNKIIWEIKKKELCNLLSGTNISFLYEENYCH